MGGHFDCFFPFVPLPSSSSLKQNLLQLFLFTFFQGATISENESFSLASYEDMLPTLPMGSELPPMGSELPPMGSEPRPLGTAEPAQLPTAPTSSNFNATPSEDPPLEAVREVTPNLLPANHVIQYSPRTASAPEWAPEVQVYTQDNPEVEPMDVDQPHGQHENDSFSCPLFPPTSTTVVSEVQVQLDHDQNLNIAGEMLEDDLKKDNLKGDIDNTTPTKLPSPKPRTSVIKTTSSYEMDTDETGVVNGGSKKCVSPNSGSPRGPVPTPRKSVTMMDVVEDNSVLTNRAASAMGNHKKISFGIAQPVSKKLSTFSLHNTTEEGSSNVDIEAEQPLQRRNSIHNVPYVDVHDPDTRERMERYKEERRSMLRAKYKVEDYMTTEVTTSKYRRKSTETKESTNVENSDQFSENTKNIADFDPKKSLNEKNLGLNNQNHEKSGLITEPDSPVLLRKDKIHSSPVREEGVIDEDVNVKERAAIFGGRLLNNKHNNINNRTKSWTASTVTSTNPKTILSASQQRPISENNGTNNRKISPGSPSKIRDMAAFFEQKN